MPVLPEEALKKLICSSCKKYLTVFPVQVYPNKNVTCGRCQERNGGTTSRLYELVASQLDFPCINQFEGCMEVLRVTDIEKHETTCFSSEYLCPLCSDFNGSSYDLLHHMKINHKQAALENTAFLVEMDQGSNSGIYFYSKNSFFVLVKYEYDADMHKLTLYLDAFGKERVNQQNITFKFLLYSVQNKLQYKTGNMQSSESGFEDAGLSIKLWRHKYPKNIIFCKFEVWNSSLIVNNYQYDKEHIDVQCNLPQIIKGSMNEALLGFKFDNISSLIANGSSTRSTVKYFVDDLLWSLNIKKIIRDEETYLSVYLCQDKKFQKTCNVEVIITLISLDNLTNRNHEFVKEDFNHSWGTPEFLKWDILFGKNSNFLKEDSIEFEVLLKVLPFKAIKCDKCQNNCPTCNKE